MTGRRKGTPCACETDPCGCGSSKGKCVRAVNNVSPDPNGDLVIRGGVGIEIIQSGDDLVINNTANPNAFVAGNNIELNPSGDDISIDLTAEPVIDGLTVNGDTQLNGDLEVNGDIIQNGAAYETHAEKIYTRDDYIIMRDGAIAALAPGNYSGFQVKLYDGVNDGRLVIDSSGTARVGDVGDEEPLLTRDESANLTDGAVFKWDAANYKAINEGTVGSDTKPLKSVNGVLTPVTNEVQTKLTIQTITPTLNGVTGNVRVVRYGQIVQIIMNNVTISTGEGQVAISGIPTVTYGCAYNLIQWYTGANGGMLLANAGNTGFTKYLSTGITNYYGTITYITDA